jgi:hypothetical protein
VTPHIMFLVSLAFLFRQKKGFSLVPPALVSTVLQYEAFRVSYQTITNRVRSRLGTELGPELGAELGAALLGAEHIVHKYRPGNTSRSRTLKICAALPTALGFGFPRTYRMYAHTRTCE